MFDFIINAFNSVKDFITQNIVNPIKQLYTDISEGYIFSGFVDFFVDTGLGLIASLGLMLGGLFLFAFSMTLTLPAHLVLAATVLAYLVYYATVFLFCYSVVQFIAKRLVNASPINLVANKKHYNARKAAIAA